MLKIYTELFAELEKNKVDYCIYKGLNHLDEDLNGNRGDIDVLIDNNNLSDFENILNSNNFKKDMKKNFPIYYFGIDEETDKYVMVDIDNKIRLGEKPYRPYFYLIDIHELKKELRNNVWVLADEDYIPLMFFQRTTALAPKQKDLIELQTLLVNENAIQNEYACSILENILDTSWEDIEKDIINAEDWDILQKKYKTKILKSVKVDYTLLFQQKFQKIINLVKRVKNKLFKVPPYKIRKQGYLVAFIGVDGAGKSSTIDYLLGLDYFKITGIKRVYFGNNEYWIPGVVWGLKNAKNRWLKMFFALLAHADRSLRSLIAYYYVKRGFIVVADRFYYDNFVGQEMTKNDTKPTKSIFKKFYRYIFKPRIWINPDITIFLDVHPDVAYSRKQDYSYEMMLVVNKAYKDYMLTVNNVVIVNANNDQDVIYNEVMSHILKLDNR